jgi:hypothetical protein
VFRDMYTPALLLVRPGDVMGEANVSSIAIPPSLLSGASYNVDCETVCLGQWTPAIAGDEEVRFGSPLIMAVWMILGRD